jgi:hypothetical protein
MTNSGKMSREPWVWFVFGLPFTAVLFGVVMLVAANYHPDDVVVDNYYEQGMGINQKLKLDDQAALLGQIATLRAITAEGLVFFIPGGSQTISLSLFHVTDRDLDLELPLEYTSDSLYVATSKAAAAIFRNKGVWYLELRDQENAWRLRARVVTPATDLTMKSK